MIDRGRRERGLATVREHMESENARDFDVTMATFDHPRYEIIPTGDVYDGPERVADDAVAVEFDLLGTHLRELRGIPATGRGFRWRVCAIFAFSVGAFSVSSGKIVEVDILADHERVSRLDLTVLEQ